MSFFAEHADGLIVNMIASYLYDLLKNKKAKNIKIDGKPLSAESKEVFEDNLKDGQDS